MGEDTSHYKRVWVQNVAVACEVLKTRLEIARANGPTVSRLAAIAGVERLADAARDAAFRKNPIPSRWAIWWRGSLVEAAYQNLHAAKVQMVELYDEPELTAEVPGAIAKARSTLHRDDPRLADLEALNGETDVGLKRARVRRIIEDYYDAQDRQHERLRSFRNIILTCALLIALLVAVTVVAVSVHPSAMPLCFQNASGSGLVCPTSSTATAPDPADILIVALLGLLGGSLAASVSIRNLRGTSTPYDVPVALAMLKVPLGAFTAIVGLVAIVGNFIPGLSNLDSQPQILAYSLVLGFAQQVFTRLLDRQAQMLLNSLPAKDETIAPPQGLPAPVGQPQPVR